MVYKPQPPESDLWIPKPADNEKWDDHTIHTHYFGFSVPEEEISVFIYIRYQPVFDLISGGTCIFKGIDNLRPLDCDHINFINTMPYPTINNNTIETKNGLRVEFLELGSKVHIQYKSSDKQTSFDITQTAVTPLLPRGHVMPGEDKHTNPKQNPGGSEQFMHCVGKLALNGREFKVDCHPVRDRSWRQVRTENEVNHPPVGWSPMYFGPDLSFNQVGYESSPALWSSLFTVDKSKPSHYFGWLVSNGEVRDIVRVKRTVNRFHPQLFIAIDQDVEAEDDKGNIYRFHGEAIAVAQLPSWPNGMFIDSLYRWTDESGRTTHCAYQEAWNSRYQRFRRGKLSTASDHSQ